MGKGRLAILCALPVLAILLIQIAYRKHNELTDVSGCYSTDNAAFKVQNGLLLVAGRPIAAAHLQYFKQDPYLAVAPGIDITASPTQIVIKRRGFSENYPMLIRDGQIHINIISEDNLQHTFIRRSCGNSRT